MLKKILLLATALVAFLATPAAAQYPGVFSATISNTNPQPGETITVEGTCEIGDEVVVALSNPGVLATIPVGDDDSFSGQVTIPADLSPGTYDLTLTCGGEVLTFTITVGSPDDPDRPDAPDRPDDETLARTGGDMGLPLKLAGALLLVGAALTIVGVKRRSATS